MKMIKFKGVQKVMVVGMLMSITVGSFADVLPIFHLHQIVKADTVEWVSQGDGTKKYDEGNLTYIYDESTLTLTVSGENIGDEYISSVVAKLGDSNVINPNNGYPLSVQSAIEKIVFTGPVVFGEVANNMFYGFTNLKEIIGLEKVDTTHVKDMEDMFNGCASLKSIDLSHFYTPKLESMYAMFQGCTSLESVDLSNFDTKNVTQMQHMFRDCSSLKSINFTDFDTTSAKSLEGMFAGCTSLSSVDVGRFNTSNVITMRNMFTDCSSLKSIDVSSFDTSKVLSMDFMFTGCSSLTELDVSNFKTEQGVSMNSMFRDCSSLKSLDLTSIHTEKSSDIGDMLQGLNLRKITFGQDFVFTIYPGSTYFEIGLPNIENEEGYDSLIYTGKWVNVGNGTDNRPQASVAYTSQELMENFKPSDGLTYVWEAKILPIEETKEIARTIRYQYENGDEVGKTVVQKAEFLRRALQNAATKEILSVEEWNKEKETFPEVVSPSIEHYTPSLVIVSSKEVTPSSNDEEIVIVYRKNQVKGADVTVRYVDQEGKEIHTSHTISGNVDDSYDLTTSEYKLSIDGYTLDERKLPSNAKGVFTNKAQTVMYVYTKDTPIPTPEVKGADVTVRYVDQKGKEIHTAQTLNGNLGEGYDVTSTKYKLSIKNYELDKTKLPSNAKGVFTKNTQTVTYHYKENRGALAETEGEEEQLNTELPKTSDQASNTQIPFTNSSMPNTGEENGKYWMMIGATLIVTLSCIIFRRQREVR